MQGLTVQGESPTRLTPRPNENIEVPNEVGRAIVLRNLARRFTESRIAIATVGLGLKPTGLTVRGLARALITSAELGLLVASLHAKASLTPTAAPPSECPHCGLSIAGCKASTKQCCPDCKCSMPVEPAGMRGSDKAVYWVDEAAILDGVESAGFDATVVNRIDVEL